MYPIDTKGRRDRMAPPRPRASPVKIVSSDEDIFAPLHTHGPLPTKFLRKFSKGRNKNRFQHRLAALYDGYCVKGDDHVIEGGRDVTAHARPDHKCVALNWITRHRAYFNPRFIKDQDTVHDLNERAERVLAKAGKLSPYISRRDHLLHRFMSACVTASIELACVEKGLKYISRHELLLGRDPDSLRIQVGDSKVEPDDVFAIEYPDGSRRAFALEVDRATEQDSLRKPGSDSQQSIARKFRNYNIVFKDQLFKRAWGVKGSPLLLFVSTEPAWLQTVKTRWAKETDPALLDRALFRMEMDFDSEWKVPSDVLWGILDNWHTVEGKTIHLSK